MARRGKKSEEIELPSVEEIEAPRRRRRGMGARNKAKGNAYERQIAQELRELGFPGVKTSRSESKSLDNNKVDIIDTEGKLPVNIQLKKVMNTPQYFKIREESTVDPETFCLIWNRQEKANVNFVSAGEVVFVPKSLFYKLIKSYSKV